MKRALIPAMILASLAVIGQQAFPTVQPEATASPVITTVSVDEAESATDQQMWSVMGDDAGRCWERPEDRFGRSPVTAVVKREGTIDVRRVDVNEINDNDWVLAWCEAPKEEAR